VVNGSNVIFITNWLMTKLLVAPGLQNELLAQLRLHAGRQQMHDVFADAAGGVGTDHPDRTIETNRRIGAPHGQRTDEWRRQGGSACELTHADDLPL
jgi:hypothetical protein